MTNLISGKEAKLAWGAGEMVEYHKKDRDEWFEIRGNTYVTVFDVMDRFRLKTRTITINGIEVPAPFEPKEGERYWFMSTSTVLGYGFNDFKSDRIDGRFMTNGAWRTEDEIKQVVAALRQIFGGV